jgi:Uma2 family endonuclease
MVDRTDIHAKHMTATEFLALPETLTPTQLINGVVVVSPSPFFIHQVLVANTYDMLKSLIPNGRVMFAPMDVHLDDENVFQPDVFWIAEDGDCHVEGGFLRGAPALVVEVLSQGTARYDKGPKFHVYEQHGVQEYWIVNPTTATLSLWTRKDDLFVAFGNFEKNARFTSPLLQQTIDTAAIFTE